MPAPSVTQLYEMSRISIDKIDSHALVNVERVNIDTALPNPQRMQHFLAQVKNPYCFLCGETPVKICFSADGKSLNTKLKNYFIALKKG